MPKPYTDMRDKFAQTMSLKAAKTKASKIYIAKSKNRSAAAKRLRSE